MEIADLEKICRNVRKHIIQSLKEARSGHPGGSLSAADLMVALYFNYMKHDPKNPQWGDRDFFILSKGHACPALYAVLAEAGYFSTNELCTLRKCKSRLQGHPATDKGLEGIEISSGSLGMGLSVGVGVALGSRIQQKKSRVYVMLSDGEHQEGSTWEGIMAAGHYGVDNLCAIVDYNGLQIDGKIENVMGIAPLIDKYRAFRWDVQEIDGHDLKQIMEAYAAAERTKNKPTVIIAHTTKGKGVCFMENIIEWHGKAPDSQQCTQALDELAGQ
ncbi:MAG: transketolase [Elusimicrobia bacterium]|nr:transketolase [Elusimicrobiota bacterium]MBD3411517.1 transketolase [Elusimicrobiota bacterium]